MLLITAVSCGIFRRSIPRQFPPPPLKKKKDVGIQKAWWTQCEQVEYASRWVRESWVCIGHDDHSVLPSERFDVQKSPLIQFSRGLLLSCGAHTIQDPVSEIKL